MLDTSHENRMLRARLAEMRWKQRIAAGGGIIAGVCSAVAINFAQQNPPLRYAMLAVALVVLVVAPIPFLRSACPSCKKRYHSIFSVFRNAEHPAPCTSCGFQINKHVSRYSQR